MSDQYILRNGQPVRASSNLEWARWYETARQERVVEQTDLPGGVKISTVFLGLDHSYGEGPPVLWETMVFGGPLDERQERYTSREDAEEGHAEMVLRAKEEGAIAEGGAI